MGFNQRRLLETRELDFRSSAILRSEDWKLFTDVSGQPISPIFKGQAAQK
jgi:hypothetical protein